MFAVFSRGCRPYQGEKQTTPGERRKKRGEGGSASSRVDSRLFAVLTEDILFNRFFYRSYTGTGKSVCYLSFRCETGPKLADTDNIQEGKGDKTACVGSVYIHLNMISEQASLPPGGRGESFRLFLV